MAITKLGNTKSAGNSLDYAKKKAEVQSGLNCDAALAKEQFKATREIWGKNGGVQAHTIIQSFEPGEITPERANEVGRKLAEEISGGREVAIYTHADKDHVHNHIIINSVHFDTGLKYQSTKSQLSKIKRINDSLCRSYGLSIADDKSAKLRYTLAEQSILQKGKDSWKDEIRTAIDLEIRQSKSYEELKINLQNKYGITVSDDINRKHIVFTHPDNEKKVRGYKLGENYTREGLQHGIKRQDKRNERGELRNRNAIRELPAKDSPSRGERRKPAATPEIERIRKSVNTLTPSGRREADEERRRIAEINKRVDKDSPAITKQQSEISPKPKPRGLELGR